MNVCFYNAIDENNIIGCFLPLILGFPFSDFCFPLLFHLRECEESSKKLLDLYAFMSVS